MASILHRIADGDQAAVQECIDEYGGLVWSIARRMLGDSGEAEDAVQDTFIDIWHSADRFDPKLASERTWVAMVARRRVIDRLREANRRPDVPLRDDPGMPPDPGHRTIERAAEARLAARALEALPDDRRRSLELAVFRGLTHREIAAAMDIPLGTVKTHITRGLAAVREALLHPEDGAD